MMENLSREVDIIIELCGNGNSVGKSATIVLERHRNPACELTCQHLSQAETFWMEMAESIGYCTLRNDTCNSSTVLILYDVCVIVRLTVFYWAIS